MKEEKKQNREKEESETRNHILEIINEEIADAKAKVLEEKRKKLMN